MTNDANIRLECLKPAERWTQPTGEEVREVLRLAGFRRQQGREGAGAGREGRPHDPPLDRRGHPDSLCDMGDLVRPGRAGRDLERGLTPRERF